MKKVIQELLTDANARSAERVAENAVSTETFTPWSD